MTSASWNFPDNRGGLAAGFNDSSIDTFKGQRLSALVRETIQNSLDAKSRDNMPVTVQFTISDINSDEIPEIVSLSNHLEKAKATAQKQDLNQAVVFYDTGLSFLKQSKIKILGIHDYNTTGLTGPITGPTGPWFALTKGAGLTQKNSGGSLGSFGHGSKAPFAFSELRTIFYYTQIKTSEEGSKRFQGKSILQSYELEEGMMSQGTGFYGIPTKGLSPLLDHQIPKWAEELRLQATEDHGTSLFIPAPVIGEGAEKAIMLVAIANFFYAIKSGSLVIKIGKLHVLNSDNIIDNYLSFKDNISSYASELNIEAIEDAFESIETIVSPSVFGEQQIPNFGRIDWYLRLSPDIETRYVSVARGNGMLITKRPPGLMRFPNLKTFDFFVCVSGEGSQILKSIENPEHNNFEFDRIDNIALRRATRRKYDNFTKVVRDILNRHAEYNLTDQIMIDDLQDLFSDISSDPSTNGSSMDRSQRCG